MMKYDLDELLKSESRVKPDLSGCANPAALLLRMRCRQISDEELERVVAAKGSLRHKAGEALDAQEQDLQGRN